MPRLTLITLTGSVDLASERRLRAHLSAAASDTSRAAVLDRRRRVMDSTGLAAMVDADQQLRRQGRVLASVGSCRRPAFAMSGSFFGRLDEATA